MNREMISILPLVAFAALFIWMWKVVASRVAQGGWVELVPQYCASRAPFGKKLRGVSGWFSRSSYSGSLTLWLSVEGLFIRPIFFFRKHHPPLLIPWQCISSVEETKRYWSKLTTVECEVDDTFFVLEIPGHHAAEFGAYAPAAVQGEIPSTK